MVVGSSGTTAAANNIYTRTRRGSNQMSYSSNRSDTVDMGLGSQSTGGGYSYRGDSGFGFYPRAGASATGITSTGTGQPYGFRYFPWNDGYNTTTSATPRSRRDAGLEMGGMTSGGSSHTEAASYPAQSKYHTFTCSKCHNPHASRLPKLMITNCLDTNHNNWDNTTGMVTSGTNTAILAVWQNSRASQWPSAINCHRLDDRATQATGENQARGTGWNRVTPWRETTSP